jgi:hypothetical protein
MAPKFGNLLARLSFRSQSMQQAKLWVLRITLQSANSRIPLLEVQRG